MSLVTEEMRNLAGSFAPSHSTALADDYYYPQILVVSLELVSQHLQAPLVEQCTNWSDV